MSRIIQIVPRLYPAVDGVGDYAFLLAQQLRRDHGIKTTFIVCDPDWKSDHIPQVSRFKHQVLLDGFSVFQLRERKADELFRVMNEPGMPANVLLQYVGYGYHQRGCPIWLVQGLSAWKNSASNRRMVTMFHEVSADGPVWSSAYWLSGTQRRVAKRLVGLTSQVLTNLQLHAQSLGEITGRRVTDFTVLPVFSNVGELAVLPDWTLRPPRMIVFGSAGWRRPVYAEHKDELVAACRALGLTEIVDIGAPVDIPDLPMDVIKRGILSAEGAGREMLEARAGFFTCPAHCLGKSGIFAAYAAHGLIPVTHDANRVDNEDGLELGIHFAKAGLVATMPIKRNNEFGQNVYAWYQSHSLLKQAGCLRGMF